MSKLALVPAAPRMEAPQVDAFAPTAAPAKAGRRKRLVLGGLLAALLFAAGYFAYQYVTVWTPAGSTP